MYWKKNTSYFGKKKKLTSLNETKKITFLRSYNNPIQYVYFF